MADHVNPVYDKEMRSELFGQGTLMLRLVIQLSMFLALPLMAVCLYMLPPLAPWYTCYVVLFNMLVGPVFSAGAMTSERERQTLELLLCTTVSPWQILSAKLYSGLRISCVLTSFLVWPLLLSWLLPPWTYWQDSVTVINYLGIILLSSLTTTTVAMFCSVVLRKTSVSMMTTYLVLMVLYAVPVAAKVFADVFFQGGGAEAARVYATVQHSTFTSPLAAAFSLPLIVGSQGHAAAAATSWWTYTTGAFFIFYGLLNAFSDGRDALAVQRPLARQQLVAPGRGCAERQAGEGPRPSRHPAAVTPPT